MIFIGLIIINQILCPFRIYHCINVGFMSKWDRFSFILFALVNDIKQNQFKDIMLFFSTFWKSDAIFVPLIKELNIKVDKR